MNLVKAKVKKGLIIKTWERCRSFGCGGRGGSRGRKGRVAPVGCFSIYVGPQKQRFVIKTEYVNHPLFKELLEEAQLEYGYKSEGPLALPCRVDLFVKVLVEVDCDDEIQQGCTFVGSTSWRSYRLLSPSRLVAMNKF